MPLRQEESKAAMLSRRDGDVEDWDPETPALDGCAAADDASSSSTAMLPLVDPPSAAAASRRSCWSCRGAAITATLASASCLATLGLLPGTAIAPLQPANSAEALRATKQEVAVLNPQGSWKPAGDACAAPMERVDIPGYDVEIRENVHSTGECCGSCNELDVCTAWVWLGPEVETPFRCYLKGVPADAQLWENVVGQVAGRRNASFDWQLAQRVSPQQAGGDLNSFLATTSPQQVPGEQPPVHQPKSLLQVLGERLSGFLHGPQAPSDDVHAPSSSEVAGAQGEPAWEEPLLTSSTTEAMQECGLIEDGVEYLGNELEAARPAQSAAECCDRCGKNENCLAWVLKSSKCHMKGGMPKDTLTVISAEGTTSGKPTQAGREIETVEQAPAQSLYCWALMLPDSYEVDLLRVQYENAWSLFGCDEYSIFSDSVIEVVDGLSTVKVQTTLDCESGGEFGTALNTPIFLAVWARLLEIGRWNHHDWTVKVDPDCPFSPSRLRGMVSWRVDAGAVYLNNCQRGMHGPLEVFSRDAVGAWESGRQQCVDYFAQQCGGDCNWGEDMFIDQCLASVLHVRRDFEEKLLREDHCDPPADYQSCSEPEVVAFHPFKSPEDYEACMQSMGE